MLQLTAMLVWNNYTAARLDVAATFKLGAVGSINNSMIRTFVIVDVPNMLPTAKQMYLSP